MIEVKYRGRLGNNLFQYALGRFLAEGTGAALKAEPIPEFPRTSEPIEGERWLASPITHTGNHFDLDSAIARPDRRHQIFHGFFQHHGWCWPRRQQLRNLYPLSSIQGLSPKSDEIVVNVRRTDYIMLGWAVPFSFYEKAIAQSKAKKVWIVTDDKKDPFFRQFKKYQPKYFSGSPLNQMRFMAAFENIVLSPSTFSWWPVVLGAAKEAYVPRTDFGCWGSEEEDSPALVPDCSPFIPIQVPSPYKATRTEAAYQELRRLNKRLRQKLHLDWRP